MAKKVEVQRVRMTDEEGEKYLTKWTKDHDLSAAEATRRIRHIAATRLAALERWTKAQKPVKKDKAKTK